MRFESAGLIKPEEKEKPVEPFTVDGKVKIGILLGLSAAAAIAFGCGNEQNDEAQDASKIAETMTPEKEITPEAVIEINGYDADLTRSLEKYLQKIHGNTAREDKKKMMLGKIDRAQRIIWQARFNGNYAGQKAYFGQIIENPEHRIDVFSTARKYADENNLPLPLVEGVMGAESGAKQFLFNPDGTKRQLGSDQGAVGIMGVTPIGAVEAKIFSREQLFSKNDAGKEVIDSAKQASLKEMLAEDMDLNIRAGTAILATYRDRYNGDLGLATAAYSGGIVKTERAIVKVYNDRQQREYASKLKAQSGKKKKKFVAPPKLETRVSIVTRAGGWSRFLAETGITLFDLIDEVPGYYPTQTYPFEVLQLGQMVDEILESKVKPAISTSLATPDTIARWDTQTRTKIARNY